MTRLIIIRHCETDYNVQNRYCGFTDPPLNSKGRERAEALAFILENVHVDKIYSSDLIRALETAGIIFKNRQIEELPAFREMNFGIFEGLKYEDIAGKYPGLCRDWIDCPVKIRLPSGEGLLDLRKRVMGGLSSILLNNKDKTVSIITHGGPMKVILCEALKFDLKNFWQIERQSGAVNIMDY